MYQNKRKEENKLKLYIRSYEVDSGESWDEERTVYNEGSEMGTNVTIECTEVCTKKRVNFFVADLAIAVKRQGEDRFKSDAVDDELAEALQEDAKITSAKRRRKKGAS